MSDEGEGEGFEGVMRRHLDGQTFGVGASMNRPLLEQLWEASRDLPARYDQMMASLRAARVTTSYEVALVFASGLVRDHLTRIMRERPEVLFEYEDIELDEDIYATVARRFAKHQQWRGQAAALARRVGLREVALPLARGERWDHTGWQRGIVANRMHRHPTGTRRQVAAGVPRLKTVGELRELLGVNSPSQLGFMLLATDTGEMAPYHTFTIPKSRGGERLIAAPGPHLRVAQRTILDQILSGLEVHDAAHGFVPGRSVLTNAAPHVGKAFVVKFDLEDFFGTINYWRVVGLFASFGYAVGRVCFTNDDDAVEVAPTLARLCCYAQRANQTRVAYTPQGAPTSPAISNLICRTLDARLAGLADSAGGDYTRYADDLTFSFAERPSKGIGRFRWWVNQICQQEGFRVREDKFRVTRASQQQRVTGIVVNDRLAIPRRERRRLRAIVHNCEQHGLASQARGTPRFADYLLGYAAYMNMVDPTRGGEMLRRVRALVDAEQPEEQP